MNIRDLGAAGAPEPGTAESVGEALANRLYAAENAIDSALTEAGALMSMLPSARTTLWLSAVTGQRIFDDAAASIQALAQARGHMVSAHNTLAALARRLGLEVLATGPVDKPEDTPPIGKGLTGVGVRRNSIARRPAALAV